MLVIIQKPSPEILEYLKTWPIWEKEISTFEWEYEETEEAYIVQGEARIHSLERPESITFKAGDHVTFPKGLKVRWEIISPIKKHFRIGEKIL